MISKERKKQLHDLNARRYAAGTPSHKARVKIKAGTATDRDIDTHLKSNPTVIPAFLESEAEAEFLHGDFKLMASKMELQVNKNIIKNQKRKTQNLKKQLQIAKPDAIWAKQQKSRLRGQSSTAGKAKRKYQDEVIIKVFQKYKARNLKQKLTTAINNIITKRTQYPNEYLGYKNSETLFRRLKEIARRARYKPPSEWWKHLKSLP